MWIGTELIHHPELSTLEKIYIRLFGAPINGLRNRARRILPLFEGRKISSLLDAGCGPGILTMELAKRYPECKVTGIDILRKDIEINNIIARKAGLKNCLFRVKDIADIEYVDEFDAILCVDNLEHIEDDVGAVTKLKKALKPGGFAIFHVPGYYRRWFWFGKSVNFDVPTHVRPGYTLEQIVDVIESRGLKVEESFYTYGYLETITNNISYKITGAQKRNKHIYAFVFPFLLFFSWLGHWSRPEWGAGVVVVAKKKKIKKKL
ncbi:MAG: class I SAM-dependent methyltransferase [Candidatus Altiarchaeota archaeon]